MISLGGPRNPSSMVEMSVTHHSWDRRPGAIRSPAVCHCVTEDAPYTKPHRQQHHHHPKRNQQQQESDQSLTVIMLPHHQQQHQQESDQTLTVIVPSGASLEPGPISLEARARAAVAAATARLPPSSMLEGAPAYSPFVLPSLKTQKSGESGERSWNSDPETDRCYRHPPTPSPNCKGSTAAAAARSSSSSSIGVASEHSFNSSGSSEDGKVGEGEVQSARRSLINLSSLEDTLPIKKGLSRHYVGQSKSFGCLADALSTNIAKPISPYARRRKHALAAYDDRHRSFPALSQTPASGISKKSSSGSRSQLALAVAMEAADQEEE